MVRWSQEKKVNTVSVNGFSIQIHSHRDTHTFSNSPQSNERTYFKESENTTTGAIKVLTANGKHNVTYGIAVLKSYWAKECNQNETQSNKTWIRINSWEVFVRRFVMCFPGFIWSLYVQRMMLSSGGAILWERHWAQEWFHDGKGF